MNLKKLPIFSHARLFVLISIFLLLSTAYNIVVPLGRGSDEYAHFLYIRFIAEHNKLPLSQKERILAGYKSKGGFPPLYQGLTGFLFSWVDSEETVFKRVNYGEVSQHALLHEVLDINWILQTDIMNYPYRGAVLLWHLSRLLAGLLTVGTIIVTYFTALALFSGNKNKAVLAATILAFFPNFVFAGTMVNDDSLLALIMTLHFLLIVLLIKGNASSWIFILLGVTLGLAILTKFSVGLVPLAMALVFYILSRWQEWGLMEAVKKFALVMFVIFLVTSWWFIFVIWKFNTIEQEGLFAGTINAVMPAVADGVSGAEALTRLFKSSEVVASTQNKSLPYAAWMIHLFKTFWAAPVAITFPMSLYLFSAALLVGTIIFVGVVRAWQSGDTFQRVWLTIFVLYILAFVPFMIIRFYLNGRIAETAQGRHILMPAALPIAILIVVGWENWTGLSIFKLARPILPAFLLFWNVSQLQYIYNIYPDPLPLSVNTTTRQRVETAVNQMFYDSFELVGYNIDTTPLTLDATLVWEAHRLSPKDYLTELRLIDGQGQIVSSRLAHAANGLYPTRVWFPREVIYDRVNLPLAGIPAGSYTLQAELVEAYQSTPLKAPRQQLFSVPISLTKNQADNLYNLKTLIIPTDEESVELQYQLWDFDFLKFARPIYHHRATIPVFWRSDDSLPPNYTVSLKWVGPSNQVFAPVNTQGNLLNFIVEANWPAGLYHLSAEIERNGKVIGQNVSGPLLEIRNKARQFTLPPTARPVEANFYHYIKLAGYNLPNVRVQPSQKLEVFVHWKALQITNANLIMFNHLYDSNNQLWASFDHILPPYYGGPVMWVPDEIVTDGYTIPIPPDTPSGIYTLRVGLFLGMGNDAWVPLPLVEGSQISDKTYVTLGPIKIGSAPADVLVADAQPQYPQSGSLGNLIKFRGYDLTKLPHAEAVQLTLYWESIAESGKDYTTFIHLLNEAGQIIAQKDNPPADGLYPTSLWEPGEIIKDKITLLLPANLPDSNYQLWVGMYDPSTGERLKISNAVNDALLLTTFETANLLQ